MSRYGRLPRTWDQRDYLARPTAAHDGTFVNLESGFPPVWDQGQLGSCFPPGTRIRMADGSERPIEDVRLLDRVVTAEGNIGQVVATMVRQEPSGLLRLRMGGHRHLRCTREHPILTARGYVPAAELRPGDEIALPRYTSAEPTRIISPIDHVRCHRMGSVILPEKIEMTPAFGRLMGLFLAEGGTDGTKVRWHYGGHEGETLVPETVRLIKETLGAEAHATQRPRGTWWVTLYGTPWNELFKALGGKRVEVKRPHPLLCSGDPDFLAAMLQGWLDGDGHVSATGAVQGVTISPDLALAMYDIAQAQGHRPALLRSEPRPNAWAATRQPRWDLKIGHGGPYVKNWSHQDDRHVWRPLRELVTEVYDGPVYDLTIEGDHSYVAEGVGVHNCVAFGSAAALAYARRKEGLAELDPSQLFVYFAARERGGYPTGQDTGLEIRDGFASLAHDGVPPAGDWPYDIAKFTQRPPALAYADGAADEAAVYGAVAVGAVDDMIASGYPVVIGFDVYASFEGDHLAQTGVMPVPARSEQLLGGHCVVLCSTLKDGGEIPGALPGLLYRRARNSWSTSWGDRGYFWYPDLAMVHASDFWEVQTVNSPNPPVPPTPGPPADVDAAFAAVLHPWVAGRHFGETRHVSNAAKLWMAAKNL